MLQGHPVEPSKHGVGIIQRTVGQDVGFNAFENPEALAETLVQRVDGAVLRHDLGDREAAGVVRGFGVIGDSEILIAARPGRLRHRLQGIDAVR